MNILRWCALSILGFSVVTAAQNTRPADAVELGKQTVQRGLDYLKTRQRPDGSWQDQHTPPAVTALALKAFVQQPGYSADTDFVRRGYEKLLSYQLDSGGIYKDMLANYNTAIAISSLAAANQPAWRDRIDRAVAYLKQLQWTGQTPPGPKGERVAGPQNPWYGGWGYGNRGRPDGSNLQMALEALHDAGLKPDDPAYKAAVTFITRMQNHSETNDQSWAGDDGGFVYTPANNGESAAGEEKAADGTRRLRSYGSMTYAGFKSMIYAGLSKDDPRVRAAFAWICRNWTLDENPGMRAGNPAAAQHGLLYYYHTLARALRAYGQSVIVDAQGQAHDWRTELIAKLASIQRPDGSWSGDRRWMEDNPDLATAYVLLAMQEALADLKDHPATKQP